MGSVSSLNPGVSDLLQTLSNVNSPILSNQSVVTALETAPSADIVQLSAAATQLEGVDTILGIGNAPTSDMFSALTSLENPADSASSQPSVLSSASTGDQLANYEAALQGQVAEGLFGAGNTTSITGSLFNAIG